MEGVENDDAVTVNKILQYDAVGRKNFNVNGSSCDSFLHRAARNRNYKICRKLVKFGADVNSVNFDDQTPLNLAEEYGEFSLCKRLVRKRKENKIMYNKQLHICVKQNDLDTCKRILMRGGLKEYNKGTIIYGVDVNEKDVKKRTPLHIAMIFASDPLCELLLKYGADIHAKDSYMDDPIQLAFYYGRFELRERMLCDLPYFG